MAEILSKQGLVDKYVAEQYEGNVLKLAKIIYYDHPKLFTVKKPLDYLRASIYKSLRKQGINKPNAITEGDSSEWKEGADGVTLTYKGGKPITSKTQAVDFFKVDLKVYEVTGFTVKSWPTTMKIKRGENDNPVQVMNYGVTVNLKKKAVELSLSGFKSKARKLKRKKQKVGQPLWWLLWQIFI